MLSLYECLSFKHCGLWGKKTFDSEDKSSVKASLNHTAEAILLLNRILDNNFSLLTVKMRGANSAYCQ